MPKIKYYNNFRVYADYNKDFINENPFMYFNLRRNIDRVLKGEVVVYKFFNILDKDNFITCLLVKDECLIYSTNVTDEIVSLIELGLEFHKFKRYTFCGTKQLINELFLKISVTYIEEKSRNYFECVKAIEPFKYSAGTASNAKSNRSSEIKNLLNLFYDEFYKKDRPNLNIDNIIFSSLLKENMFQWLLDDKVVGLIQVDYEEFDYPVIRLVMVHPDFRGIGIGSSFVHKITKGLFERGHKKCWLMTDAYNPFSNYAFKKVGYNLTGEYIVRYKQE